MTNRPVNYTNINYQEEGATYIEGVRGVDGSDNVYISGMIVVNSSLTNGFLYEGPLDFNGLQGTWNTLMFPGDDVVNTSCYGPNNLEGGGVQLVGSYKTTESGSRTLGFLYEGPTDGSGAWTQVAPNNGDTNMVFVHSVMGGFAVGNYDTKDINAYAFIYDISTKEFTEIAAEGAYSTTLYGIWHNGGTSYTLAGGCSFEGAGDVSQAFIVDWDSTTKTPSNWKMYQYLNQNIKSVVTHFEGITSDGSGGYNLPSDWVSVDPSNETPVSTAGAFVHIRRNEDGTFSDAEWTELQYPLNTVTLTSANTAYENNILGLYVMPNNNGGMYTISYCAEIG